MVVLYFIVALFTASSSNDRHDVYIFDNPSFTGKLECVEFVKNNFKELNLHVNEQYNARWDNPNLFFCLNKKEIRDIKDGKEI